MHGCGKMLTVVGDETGAAVEHLDSVFVDVGAHCACRSGKLENVRLQVQGGQTVGHASQRLSLDAVATMVVNVLAHCECEIARRSAPSKRWLFTIMNDSLTIVSADRAAPLQARSPVLVDVSAHCDRRLSDSLL